jgi:GGDEF domain-containing protein
LKERPTESGLVVNERNLLDGIGRLGLLGGENLLHFFVGLLKLFEERGSNSEEVASSERDDLTGLFNRRGIRIERGEERK